MIHKLIRLVEEFKEFRKVQHSVKSIELSNTHKNMILSYNKDFEKELNSLIIRNLSDSMIE